MALSAKAKPFKFNPASASFTPSFAPPAASEPQDDVADEGHDFEEATNETDDMPMSPLAAPFNPSSGIFTPGRERHESYYSEYEGDEYDPEDENGFWAQPSSLSLDPYSAMGTGLYRGPDQGFHHVPAAAYYGEYDYAMMQAMEMNGYMWQGGNADDGRPRYSIEEMLALREANTEEPPLPKEFFGLLISNLEPEDDDYDGDMVPAAKKKGKSGKKKTAFEEHMERAAAEASRFTTSGGSSKKKKKNQNSAKKRNHGHGHHHHHHGHHPNPDLDFQGNPIDKSNFDAPLKATSGRWVPKKATDEKSVANKAMRNILNKLTPEKFDKLFDEVLAIKISQASTLELLAKMIFDKAVFEPKFASMYSDLCKKLTKQFPEFLDSKGKSQTFRGYLLTDCYMSLIEAEDQTDAMDKQKDRANFIFIGELYKHNLLASSIMHKCIKMLIGDVRQPVDEDVEALCILVRTIGQLLEERDERKLKKERSQRRERKEEAKRPTRSKMHKYFTKLLVLSKKESGVCSRLRFMLQDVIELRRNGWNARRVSATPVKLGEIASASKQQQQGAGWRPLKPALKRSATEPPPPRHLTRVARHEHKEKDGGRAHGRGRQGQGGTSSSTMTSPAPSTPISHSNSHSSRPKTAAHPQLALERPSPLRPVTLDMSESNTPPTAMPLRSVSDNTQTRSALSATSPRTQFSEEQIERKISSLLSEYLVCRDIGEAMLCISDINDRRPTAWSQELLYAKLVKEIVNATLEKNDKQQVQCQRLIELLWSKKVIGTSEIIDGMSEIVGFLEDLAIDVPMAPKHFASMLASLLQCQALNCKAVCELVVPSFSSLPPLHEALQELASSAHWEVMPGGGGDKVLVLLQDAGLQRSQYTILHRTVRLVDVKVLFPELATNGF